MGAEVGGSHLLTRSRGPRLRAEFDRGVQERVPLLLFAAPRDPSEAPGPLFARGEGGAAGPGESCLELEQLENPARFLHNSGRPPAPPHP